jgi:hypothetical protein
MSMVFWNRWRNAASTKAGAKAAAELQNDLAGNTDDQLCKRSGHLKAMSR